ncbi:MAG: hypothetical protein ACK4R9_00690 [Ignavibacterium sp.]
MIEGAYRILTGFDIVIRYDRLDVSAEIQNDEISQLIFGVEFQPYSFIEIRPQYRFVTDYANRDLKNDSFVLQFHFWY